jgi:hypothetical protein
MKKKRTAIGYYDSLDAPVFVWQKIHEDQDLSWLLIKKQKVTKAIMLKLQKAWDKIYDQFIKEFGLSESFLEILKKEAEIAKLKLKLVLTGDRINITWINIKEEELHEMKKGIGKAGFLDSKKAIEYKFKFQINVRTTSIKEFYSYLKDIK